MGGRAWKLLWLAQWAAGFSAGGRNAAVSSVPDGRDRPLSEPPEDAVAVAYRADLARVRGFAAAWGRRVGLPPHRVTDLVLVVGELTANTLAHTGGPGVLRLWVSDREVVCQVEDEGQIADPHAGMHRPDPGADGGGRGLWVVRLLGEQVKISRRPEGITVRVCMPLYRAS